MSEEKSRAEFEQFAAREYGVTTLRRSPTRPERYVDMYLQRYWEVWQAARERCGKEGGVDLDGSHSDESTNFSEEIVTDAVVNPYFDIPPYHVEGFPCGWHCVINANSFNCLTFRSKPGAVFTSRENTVEIARRWNV